jgi:hypothetical protein
MTYRWEVYTMISLHLNRYKTIVVLALIYSVAWGGEPNDTPIQIEFEISSTALRPSSHLRQAWPPYVPNRPAYAAGICLMGPSESMPLMRGRGLHHDFFRFVTERASVSPQQKDFLRDSRTVLERGGRLVVDRIDPNGPECVLLYAVTQEDARKMAQAYFQYAIKDFQGRVAGSTREIRANLAKIEETEKKLAEVEKLIETTPKLLEELRKTVPYRTESEAQEAVGELDRIINTAQVEAAGLKARVQAIQTHLQEAEARKMDLDLVERLDAMFIEESILLQGAEARKQMATQLREQANRFMDLHAALGDAVAERKTLPVFLHRLREDLARAQANLQAAEQNEPRIPEKVTIYPIAWPEEPTGD